ncbi:Tafazzin [Parasponia andersonii]|uniref:Tafazzin n=1 Tax=Parasponia andersonii TaxID=3476 RepID=A0A2P5AK42_PARAD|nr:Tafazzin [Parasponia andersonii]
MPENFLFGRRPPVPLCNNKISITVGDPIEFDLPKMRQMAISVSHKFSLPLLGWPSTPDGLDEAAQRCLYSVISEKIRTAMESLRIFGTEACQICFGLTKPLDFSGFVFAELRR